MTTNLANTYDEVLYPNNALPQTHPDRLATIATLFGMQPASPEKCRVLELGCGDGGNLIPMALTLPDSQFVGIDLAGHPVSIGQRAIEELGLKNISLHQMDVMDIGKEFGAFDYISAHGLYSWVPDFVRDKILSVSKENLSPNGVAYISYNVYPGCHFRQILREMMLFHVKQFSQPSEKVHQAQALIKFLADSQPKDENYGRFLSEELDQLSQRSEGGIFHDDLAEINVPVYFHQFVEHAAEHGLKFLAEADFFEMQTRIYPPQTVEALQQLSGNIIVKEQYLDFLKGRRFRQTLLCHQDLILDSDIKAEKVRELFIASSARPVSERPEINSEKIEEFKGHKKGAAIKTDHRLAKAAMLVLGNEWPRALSFNELLEKSLPLLGLDQSVTTLDKESSELAAIFLSTYAAGLIDLHLHRPKFSLEVSERPVVSPLVRMQLKKGVFATNLLHNTIRIDDPLGRYLLIMLDGTRDRKQLVADMFELIKSGAASVKENGEPVKDMDKALRILNDGLDQNLSNLAKLALLIE
jgi:methyltransferase-like protein/cyclopropane fatty-acyl-phospholipid synthase-like methyltransferase